MSGKPGNAFDRRRWLQATLAAVFAAPPPSGMLQQAFERAMAAPPLPEGTEGRASAVLLLDPDSGRVLAGLRTAFFFGPRKPCGSLIKPFTALAFLLRHSPADLPRFLCPPAGGSQGDPCWNPQGHGLLTLEQALAHSCNSYFRQLALELDPADFARLLYLFGLETGADEFPRFDSFPGEEQRRAMTGSSPRLAVPPIRLALAYAALYNGGRLFLRQNPEETSAARSVYMEAASLAVIQRGMRLSAQEGTGRLAGAASSSRYVKTGTHSLREGTHRLSDLEGWCLAVDRNPAEPLLVMTFVHPGRGATEAAPLAAKTLAVYRRLRPARRSE